MVDWPIGWSVGQLVGWQIKWSVGLQEGGRVLAYVSRGLSCFASGWMFVELAELTY